MFANPVLEKLRQRISSLEEGQRRFSRVIPVSDAVDRRLPYRLPRALAPSARFNPTAFKAVRFQPPDPYENREDGGIQAQCARGVRPEVSHDLVYRYKILRGRVAERARDLIRQICQARDVVIKRSASPSTGAVAIWKTPPGCLVKQ
jgi:hypothetical protein